MTVRTYRRRSKNDEGKQQFSLDVQSAGCGELVARLGLAEHPLEDYLDDGRAGDDFLTRPGLRQLMTDAQRGDVIICRDQSRLGRDAIEVTLAIRNLVRDRGCRLYYYVTGQEVLFANAIDQATTFIQGTGHQMELEAIRSRTREALRSRVRAGRIAGGSCYGYRLERKSDGFGRKYTTAVVDEAQAEIVHRIFDDYLAGRGLKQIAHRLNADGVAPPSAGRRGTGSWAPSSIRPMLHNPRYRGVYIHGRIKKIRQAGTIIRTKADPQELIQVELPEWRIIDDATWFAVQEKFGERGPQTRSKQAARYPLTGIARCTVCMGTIAASRSRHFGGGHARMTTYACARHHERGSSVCPVTIHQPREEVEMAIVDHLHRNVLTDAVLDSVMNEIRREMEAQLQRNDVDIAAIKSELQTARTEQKRLAKAVAMVDDVAEIVTELRQRQQRIQHLEAQLAAARRTPAELATILERVEGGARNRLAELRAGLSEQSDLRQLFLMLFPDGLEFTPARTPDGSRQIWRIRGAANYGAITDGGLVPSTTRPQRDSKGDSLSPGDTPCEQTPQLSVVGVAPSDTAEHRSGTSLSPFSDPIAAALAGALDQWRADRDERDLRRALLKLLADLD